MPYISTWLVVNSKWFMVYGLWFRKLYTIYHIPYTNPKGFTLIEILVVIGIISIVTLIGIPNLRRFNEGQEFQSKVSEFLNDLKKMQSNSQASIVCSSAKASKSWNLKILGESNYQMYPICNDSSEGDKVDKALPEEISISDIETDSMDCSNFDTDEVIISFINSSRSADFSGNNCITPSLNKLNVYFEYKDEVAGVSITRGGAVSVCELDEDKKCI